jgi:apolipoprotein N-acyltransferase
LTVFGSRLAKIFVKLIGKMNKLSRLRKNLLSPSNAGLAIISAILLILAFPGFEIWFLAWIALVPLFFAIEREKESFVKSFLVGWLFGLVFFFGTCWWLTFAPITYAGMPWLLVYFFMFCAAAVVGIFPGIFAALFSVLIKRFGSYAILSAPFLWTFTEFLRMWLTGNNWNAIGYSQAFFGDFNYLACIGGVLLVSFIIVALNSAFLFSFKNDVKNDTLKSFCYAFPYVFIIIPLWLSPLAFWNREIPRTDSNNGLAEVIAVQPNVPMNGLTLEKYQQLLTRHVELAENALKQRTRGKEQPTTIIFPESPMIFQYGRDEDLQNFLRDFAVRNNASVLFNSAEMSANRHFLNSAVMINEKGEKTAQYDKIHLLPFGEYIPFPEPIASQMPAFVGNFQFGSEYDLLPFGAAKGGVMICFESHFGELSREYARRGADVLIEMTNDGYLGNTPVLRQHLANSVFRAVETNRPLLRVTNVGITAYINERGEVSDAADVYTEAARVWTISKSDGEQTIYVKYGDWFAWTCSLVSLALIIFSFISRQRRKDAEPQR